MANKRFWVDLYDYEKEKKFRKYFESESSRDKFIAKLRYSKKILVVEVDPTYNGRS